MISASKILVTGANGQLGSELKEHTESSGFQFVFTDIDTLDLNNKDALLTFLKSENPDFIINCAAYTAVDNAEDDQELAMKLNAEIPAILIDYCDKNNCKLIHISTDYVFKGELTRPLVEADKTDPGSIYGKSKLAGEKAISSSPNSLIIRTSWLYSSYGKNFVKSMLRLMKEREQLGIVFDQIGTPTYAADLAEAIIKILNKSVKEFQPGIYHFSNEGVASWFDLASEIKAITKSNCEILPIETKDYPLPAVRPPYAVLNKEKIKSTFGLSIPYWKISLEKCIEKLK